MLTCCNINDILDFVYMKFLSLDFKVLQVMLLAEETRNYRLCKGKYDDICCGVLMLSVFGNAPRKARSLFPVFYVKHGTPR